MNSDFTNELMHFGIKHRSGRYPWGSGERPYQSGGGGFAKSNKKLQRKANTASKMADRYANKSVAAIKAGNIKKANKYAIKSNDWEYRKDLATSKIESNYGQLRKIAADKKTKLAKAISNGGLKVDVKKSGDKLVIDLVNNMTMTPGQYNKAVKEYNDLCKLLPELQPIKSGK